LLRLKCNFFWKFFPSKLTYVTFLYNLSSQLISMTFHHKFTLEFFVACGPTMVCAARMVPALNKVVFGWMYQTRTGWNSTRFDMVWCLFRWMEWSGLGQTCSHAWNIPLICYTISYAKNGCTTPFRKNSFWFLEYA
jgi:hypothetical protein